MNDAILASLPYAPKALPRELLRHYIAASDDDIEAMLESLGLKNLEDLFAHIPEDIRRTSDPDIEDELEYDDLVAHMQSLANKNKLPKASFIGDGLQQYKAHEMSAFTASLRELTTAYTPYQPERSQGTLMTHWIYQSMMSKLTGFEAINVSMYDRASTLFEAMLTSIRLQRKKGSTVLVAENIFAGDLKVLFTLRKDTHMEIEITPYSRKTGKVDLDVVKEMIEQLGDDVCAMVFPQTTRFGNLEEVDAITDLLHEKGLLAISVIDPILLGTGGLKPPTDFGQQGVDLFVAEGQHIAIGPNFGGPGLGVFGVRFNDEHKNEIRSTPGRFTGEGVDVHGRPCKTQVISTREQHIRREKATSNICSNQAFVATMAGAALLARGEKGMADVSTIGHRTATSIAKRILLCREIELRFPEEAFFNEFTIHIPDDINECLAAAQTEGLHIGVNISKDEKGYDNLLKISCSDLQSEQNIENLCGFFENRYGKSHKDHVELKDVPHRYLRQQALGLADFEPDELKLFYRSLAGQNISPDSSIYPLGSCTMKYNPYINDYAAGLDGFAMTHPQAPDEDVQGNLEVIYYTQEVFKRILGLKAVTTQPVAGAQGEWVGLKLFQAYHRSRADKKRDIILIPRSAHGTNPATATMAGFTTVSKKGKESGIVLIEADSSGQIDMAHLTSLVDEFSERIAGIMVTNPNTSGIFESRFKEIATMIHEVGGLVYMDGANLNAIAGWLDLGEMGVDAVHSNTHKTWSIPHGGGGPGDAFVAVSEKLEPFLPGIQVIKNEDRFEKHYPDQSIGSCHRHFGNFGHKVRCYTYVRRLGKAGIRKMSAVAVLAARYLKQRLSSVYPTLPPLTDQPSMHEFILTLPKDLFAKIEKVGIPKASIITRVGKLFLDFGFHAPTVAFPEVLGIMVEPTESYSKAELDRFADAVIAIYKLLEEHPEVLLTAPHFTPIDRVDDVAANRSLILHEDIQKLPDVLRNRISPEELAEMPVGDISAKIIEAHEKEKEASLAQ